MDPDACWKRALEAIEASDLDEAIAALEDLCTWLGKGGFHPKTCPLSYKGIYNLSAIMVLAKR